MAVHVLLKTKRFDSEVECIEVCYHIVVFTPALMEREKGDVAGSERGWKASELYTFYSSDNTAIPKE